jgi:Dyp-type peroxidase family
MADYAPILEGPALGPLTGKTARDEPGRSNEGRSNEEVFAVDQIQGNIFPGFLKDFQTLLFLQITDPAAFAQWLKRLLPRIATMEMVVAFNRLHKYIRYTHQSEAAAPKITWINVAFSYRGLTALKPKGVALEDFKDQAFTDGLYRRSQSSEGNLGDPVDPHAPGHPDNWVIGGPNNEADVLLIVAGDDPGQLKQEVERLESTIPSSTSGAKVIFRQDGAVLTGPLGGHEHFGFRDSISQPGIRGKLPDGTFLTPNQNPHDINQGKPGQDLIWPGEFVFGYPGQDANQPVVNRGVDPLKSRNRQAPDFAENGSFLVFRRLRQHVFMFHDFLKKTAAHYQVSPDLVGARMIGRWASGAPAVRLDEAVPPGQDNLALAYNDCRNNHFQYAAADAQEQRQPQRGDCRDETPPPDDPQGFQVPFAAHIRKAYPRNDRSNVVNASLTQTHRLLRRGIPYGEQSRSTPDEPVPDDDVDRGLLFLAYQVSITDQFEFITQNWLNSPGFSRPDAGHDPIVGQNPSDPKRARSLKMHLPGARAPIHIQTDHEWVVPTGGGYFFAPSIDALKTLAGIHPASARKTLPSSPPWQAPMAATLIPANFTSNYIDDLIAAPVTPNDDPVTAVTVTVHPSDAPSSTVSFTVDDKTLPSIVINAQAGKKAADILSANLQPNKDRVFASIEGTVCTNFQFPPQSPTPAIGFSGKFIDHRFLGPVSLYYPSENVVLIRTNPPDSPQTCTFPVTTKATIVINGQAGKPSDILALQGNLISARIDYGICTKFQCNPGKPAGPID